MVREEVPEAPHIFVRQDQGTPEKKKKKEDRE